MMTKMCPPSYEGYVYVTTLTCRPRWSQKKYLPLSHGTETPHLAKSQVGVIRTQVRLVLVEVVSLVPVVQTLIPLLLHLLQRNIATAK